MRGESDPVPPRTAGPAGQKTQYRAVSNGHWDWLEYGTPHRFLWFRWTEWNRVPKAFSRWPYPRGYFTTAPTDEYVNCLNDNLPNFIAEWPYIGDYLIHFAKEQAKYDARWDDMDRKIMARRGQITALGPISKEGES